MSWARRFRTREYMRGSLWVLPLAGGVLGVLAGSGDLLLEKGLSPPTVLSYSSSTASTLLTTIVGATAVQVIDHLADVLRRIGSADLSRSQRTGEHDTSVGLLFPIRSREDYLTLATTEIRCYGASAIQVMRRMRAMLEELHHEVREEHRPAIDEELGRLDATVARSFADSVDIDRALTADPQGMGGRSGAVTPRPAR
jgi:uncharacterized membrane protein